MQNSSNVRSWIKMSAVALALGACNTPPAPTDANHTPLDTGADAGGTSGPVSPGGTTASGAAMLGCVGTSTVPTAGASIPITMELDSFGQHGDTAHMTDVCFCPDNVLSAEALAPTLTGGCGTCQHATSDGNGRLSLMANTSGWYAYRVFYHQVASTTSSTFLDSIQVNEVAPAASGGMVTGNAVSQLTANLISEAELVTRQPGTVTVAGRIFDCAGDDVRGGTIRAFHADGSEIVEGTETAQAHFRYFDGSENPDASGTFTNTDGLYVVVNAVPASPAELIRVEAWAYTGAVATCTSDAMCTGGTCNTDIGECVFPSHRIGCEAVQALTNGVAIVNIGPERSDYHPVGGTPHPCAAH